MVSRLGFRKCWLDRAAEEKCWKHWDFSKNADDPGEVARQFMRVTAAKRRGFKRSRSR